MKIVVCVRFVGTDLQPFDAAALECALASGAEVTALSLGPASAAAPLRALTRLGVSRAVLLSDPAFAGSDTLATARILAAALARLSYDYVFCGRTSTEGETAQVGPMLSVLCGLPLFPGVMAFSPAPAPSVVLRSGASGPLPPRALCTVERAYLLRFPSIRSRMGEAEVWDNRTLGLPAAAVGLAGSPTRVLRSEARAVGERHCRMIAAEELPALLSALPEKAAAAEKPPVTDGEKLPVVMAVGDAVAAAAAAVGKTVVHCAAQDPHAVADAVRAADPDAVLFPADDAGRVLAPQVAALCGAGLCADCTALAVENGRLIFTRPAKGGSLMADIVCTTRPAMGSVRCESAAHTDIVLGCGLGTRARRADCLALAARLGARMAASRALVDTGEAPYAEQIGLTGVNLACRVYLAVGISGAVQHTCALDGADTVIAVNPDPDARIFACADYGVRATLDDLLRVFAVR